MPFFSFLEANRPGANRRWLRRFRKLGLELLEDRLAPAHLQLFSGGIGFLATASANGQDTKSAQQIVTDLQIPQNLSDQASAGNVGTAFGTVGVTPGNLTNEGVDVITLTASGLGGTANASFQGAFSEGTVSTPIAPDFGTPVQLTLVADAGDKMGQAVTLHMNSQVTGSGTSGPGGSAQFSYSVTAVNKGQTISGVNGSFNPLDGADGSTIRASSQKTFATRIGDTFTLTVSLTGSGEVSGPPDNPSSPGSFGASLSAFFFITSPPPPPTGGLNWNKNSKAGGGFIVNYDVPQDMPLADGSTLGFYWADGPDLSNILNVPDDPAHVQALTADQETPGNHQILIKADQLGIPPESTMYLIVTIDPPGAPGTEPIGNLLASPKEILTDAVHPFILDIYGIGASFQPEGGALTLDQAAAIEGVDHFNWQQTYTDPANVKLFQGIGITFPSFGQPTNVSTPATGPQYTTKTDSHSAGALVPLTPLDTAVFDPVVRTSQQEGYFAEVTHADGSVTWEAYGARDLNPLPTYLSEGLDKWNWSVHHGSGDKAYGKLDDFTLQFYDRPTADADFYDGRNGVAPAGRYIQFETSLIGVAVTGQIQHFAVPRTSFGWKTNTVGVQGVIQQVILDGSPLPAALSGGVFDVVFDDGTPVPPRFVADAIGVARPAADGVGATQILDSHGTGSFTPDDPVLSFGLATDTFISGDWTGDGTSKIGVVRPDDNGSLLWVLDTVGDGVYRADVDLVYHFGLPGDRVVVGDWTGDGKSKIGVVRPNAQGGLDFALDTNGNGAFDSGDQVILNFGLAGDQIVIGDWNGDGKAKIGVARADGVTSDIALDTNGDGVFSSGDQVFQYGLAGDKFIAGDWNASGVAKIGSYRPDGLGSLLFSLDTNGDGQFDAQDQTFHFGLASDAVLTGKWHT